MRSVGSDGENIGVEGRIGHYAVGIRSPGDTVQIYGVRKAGVELYGGT